MLQKARTFLLNLLLFAVVLLLAYMLAEWAFLRVFPRLFPLEAVQKFDEPEGVWPVLQASKRGFLPQEDYIALLGDSYAMGMGDAMLAAGRDRQPRFHSAHDIQQLTGRDVVSFGLPGSGSVRGMVGNPVAGLHYLRSMVDERFPDPAWVVVYFYEGNDLTENVMYHDRTFPLASAAVQAAGLAGFPDYVREVVLGRQHLALAADAAGREQRQFLWRYGNRVVGEKLLGRKYFRKKYPGELGLVYVPEQRWQPHQTDEPTNLARIDGQTVALPDNLQGPALDLTEAQLQQAVGIFSQSLTWSRAHFPQARFAVVYIPSVLSVYELIGERVSAQDYFRDQPVSATSGQLQQRHDAIRAGIARICHEQGVAFADATADLRQAAAGAILHGPQDWNHFNRRGYRVLGESVVRQLPAFAEQP